MMPCTRPHRLPAFTILECLILLPFIAFLLGLVLWGFRAQISTHRRITEQANRQAVMRSVLNNLRADLADAEHVEFEVLDGQTVFNPFRLPSKTVALVRGAIEKLAESPARWFAPARRSGSAPADSPVWVLRIDRPGGFECYRLYDYRPPRGDAGGGREWSFPQILRREDGDGGLKEWRLCGQTLACGPAPHAPWRAVVVRFASRLSDEAGPESYHVFETTLLTGGRP
jgi:type II secretory pathway pseudopilin PulG